MANPELTDRDLFGYWLTSDEARSNQELLLRQMFKAENNPKPDNPVQLLKSIRRLSYFMDMLLNPYHNIALEGRSARWLLLDSGIAMKHRGRKHETLFVDADPNEAKDLILELATAASKKDYEFRYVTDATLARIQHPRSLEALILGILKLGNANWEYRGNRLLTRVSLQSRDYQKPDHQLAKGYENRKLRASDGDEVQKLFDKHYQGNAFRQENIDDYDGDFGILTTQGADAGSFVAVQGIVGEFTFKYDGSSHHVYLVGDGVTHADHRRKGLATQAFVSVVNEIFSRDPNAIIIGDAANITMIRICRELGFQGGGRRSPKDRLRWSKFEMKKD